MIRADALGKPMAAPTMSRVMQQLKGSVSRQSGAMSREIPSIFFANHKASRQMVGLPGFFQASGRAASGVSSMNCRYSDRRRPCSMPGVKRLRHPMSAPSRRI